MEAMDGKEPVSVPGAVPSWNALPSSVLCRRVLLGISAARSPRAPCCSLSSRWGFWVSPLNLGMFPCCARLSQNRPFRSWFGPILAPHYWLEMMFCLSLLLATSSDLSLSIPHLCSPTFLCLLVFPSFSLSKAQSPVVSLQDREFP